MSPGRNVLRAGFCIEWCFRYRPALMDQAAQDRVIEEDGIVCIKKPLLQESGFFYEQLCDQ